MFLVLEGCSPRKELPRSLLHYKCSLGHNILLSVIPMLWFDAISSSFEADQGLILWCISVSLERRSPLKSHFCTQNAAWKVLFYCQWSLCFDLMLFPAFLKPVKAWNCDAMSVLLEGRSPLKKPPRPFLHKKCSLRRAIPLSVILMQRFDAISSLPEIRLIRTSFSPPFKSPWDPLCTRIVA